MRADSRLRIAGQTLAIILIAMYAHVTRAGATFDAVKAGYRPSDTVIVDRDGEWLHRLRTDSSVRRGTWVALTEISPALRTALVLSEDKRFYEHSGVDWQAVSSAAWGNLWNTRTRGASTITMQLAGLLHEDLKRGSGGRSAVQKLGQTVSASLLERSWRKDQILEAYLNLVPFRGELVGIDAMSTTLFGKAAHGLDATEAAVAAAMVRAPNAGPTQVSRRACSVLKQLQTGRVECDALDLFASDALQQRRYSASEGIAAHVARQMTQKPAHATTIRSTLRAPLQRFASQTLHQHLRELTQRHVEDAAVLVLDNPTGEVLAWVGSTGELSRAGEVDFVSALRQPGSTLKPFLYAQAIAERRLTAASLIEDSGTQIPTASGLYIPQNYDHQFKGWVSVRTALGASLNVPAVRTLGMVSPDSFHKQLVKVGLPLRESGDYFGFSLALGSAEVSLLHLTNAYRTLANAGRVSAVTLTPAGKPVWKTALDPRAAYIIGDILSDPAARTRTFGPQSILATRFWTAVKTGTSKDMRDNWTIGWSQRYTVGVWVGNGSGAPMWDVSGTTGAAPIWVDVMNYLHARQGSHAPKAPPGLVQLPVQFTATGDTTQAPQEASRKEWFIAGTQQPDFAIHTVANSIDPARDRGKITAPIGGTVIALDPDIPPKNQRLTLRADGSNLRWKINGKAAGSGPAVQWMPWPGRHAIQIVGPRGNIMDEVHVVVRGAGVKPP